MMINIMTAYKTGLVDAFKEKKMLFWLYGFNLIFAYLLTMPVSMMLNKALNNTSAASNVLEAFDISIFATIMEQYGKSLSFSRSILTIGLLYMIVNIFFTGGILKVFSTEGKFTLAEFFAGCVEYVNRFLRLFLLSVLWLILIFILQLILSTLFGLLTKNSSTEHLGLILFIVRLLLIGVLLAFINMIFDYAKIITVNYDYRAMFKTMINAIVFVMKSFGRTSGLYAFYLLTAVIFLILYLVLESSISVSGVFSVLLFFIISQIYMLTRVWIRLGFFAGQYAFYRQANITLPELTKEGG